MRLLLGTQAAVARRLGVARSTVAHREGGRMVITTEAALAISALGTRAFETIKEFQARSLRQSINTPAS